MNSSEPLIRSVLIGAVAATAAVGSVVAADRVVLGEYFTHDESSFCWPTDDEVSRLIDSYPGVAVVVYQLGPECETPWGNARYDFYYDSFVGGAPVFIYDGLEPLWTAWPLGDYHSKLQARLSLPTDMTVTLDAVATALEGTFDVIATVCVESGGQDRSVRVSMVSILDGYPSSCTFPGIQRNGLWQAAATEDVSLLAGECSGVMRTFSFNTGSSPTLIAWVQEPNNAGPAEVFQAAKLAWPFRDTPFFANGFESGDLAGWSTSLGEVP